jgi:hypothetical protein
MKSKLKNIKNTRELDLYKQNLEYRAKFYEKEVAGITEDVIDNFTDKIKDFTFNLAFKLVSELFTKKGKK